MATTKVNPKPTAINDHVRRITRNYEGLTREQLIDDCADLFVATDGLIYLTDYDAGLYILQWKGA